MVVGGALLLAACGGGGSSTKVGPTTSVAPPSTTAIPPSSTTLPGPTNPEGLARGLFDAWKAGDRGAAARFATPSAVNEVFARPFKQVQTNAGPTDQYKFKDCQVQASGSAGVCTFTAQDSELDMTIGTSGAGRPLAVTGVKFQDTGTH